MWASCEARPLSFPQRIRSWELTNLYRSIQIQRARSTGIKSPFMAVPCSHTNSSALVYAFLSHCEDENRTLRFCGRDRRHPTTFMQVHEITPCLLTGRGVVSI